MNILYNIISEEINNLILEYSSEKKLPFDEDEFKNKNYLEQYTDWLEDFGKYGELPASKLNFWDEIKKAINTIIENHLQNRLGLGLKDKDVDEILSELQDIIGNNLVFNNKGNLYVERSVIINGKADTYDKSNGNGNDPTKLYNSLIQNYQNNVGGCWSYKTNGSESYCSMVRGDNITIRGYIRLEDIDFVKTVLLNFYYDDEHEIRVKPKAQVELFEVLFDGKYKIPLRGRLIVNATYFGNNSTYDQRGYAKVDDGFGNYDYMDREGNIYDLTTMVNQQLSKGVDPKDIFDKIGVMHEGLTIVELNNKYSFIDSNNRLIGDGKLWFNDVGGFNNGFAKVNLNDKWSFIDTEGNYIKNGKLWFDRASNFKNGFASVGLNNKYTFIDTNGNYIKNGELWFDYASPFKTNFAIVELNNKYSLLSIEGNLIYNGKLWFDELFKTKNDFYRTRLNNKWTFINPNGKLIGGGNLWFSWIDDFINDFAKVELKGKFSFINTNGELIGNGKLWFDTAYDFNNGYAVVKVNNGVYNMDTNLNFYDYYTDKPITSPFQSTNENKINITKIIKESINSLIYKKLQ